jgi:hypothetical protein
MPKLFGDGVGYGGDPIEEPKQIAIEPSVGAH